jgi:hypothetical protein
MARYDSDPDFADAFPGGRFNSHADRMTAPGSVPGGGAVGDAMSVENNHSLTSPDTSAYSSGSWDRHTVPVTPDSISIPQQTDGYRPGGFGPYTGGDVGHTGLARAAWQARATRTPLAVTAGGRGRERREPVGPDASRQFRPAVGIRPETRLPTDDELRRAVEV